MDEEGIQEPCAMLTTELTTKYILKPHCTEGPVKLPPFVRPFVSLTIFSGMAHYFFLIF